MKYGKYWFHLQIIFFIANFHVLGHFIPKKSDALVGRVNTFIILHTKSLKTAFKIWRPLNLQIPKISFSHSESEFVWEDSKDSKFWNSDNVVNF
jgi:hypothetical protein